MFPHSDDDALAPASDEAGHAEAHHAAVDFGTVSVSAEVAHDALGPSAAPAEVVIPVLSELVAETVPELVAETVPELVAETVPELVAETVPELVAETVPELVAETVPELVAETVPVPVVLAPAIVPAPPLPPPPLPKPKPPIRPERVVEDSGEVSYHTDCIHLQRSAGRSWFVTISPQGQPSQRIYVPTHTFEKLLTFSESPSWETGKLWKALCEIPLDRPLPNRRLEEELRALLTSFAGELRK